MIYNAKNIIGQFAVDQDSGTKLYEMIYAEIASGQSIELDFAEVRVYSATFLSWAIAQLLRDFSPDKLNKCLTIKNLPAHGCEVLRSVIANAKKILRPMQKRSKLEFKRLRSNIELAIPMILHQQIEDQSGISVYYVAGNFNCSVAIAKEVMNKLFNEKKIRRIKKGKMYYYFLLLQ